MAKPKIRHIALATKDPQKVANFYKAAFDLKEVGRAGPPNPKPGQGCSEMSNTTPSGP